MGHLAGKQCPMLLLIKLLLQITSAVSSELSRSMSISYDHGLSEAFKVEEYATSDLNVTLKFPKSDFEADNIENYMIGIDSFHPETATGSVNNKLIKSQFRLEDQYYQTETIITVKGNLLGKTAMKLKLVPAKDWNDVQEMQQNTDFMSIHQEERDGSWLDVWVLRSADSIRLTKYFVLSVVILISFANVMMGCELDMEAVVATLRKPVAPAIGLFAQFIIMPLLSYLIAYAIFMPRGQYSMALGLFVTGCSPGGGASNFWTLLLDGNLNLSVTMTFCSTICSLFMMPMWLHFFGSPFLQGFAGNVGIKVPYVKIVSSLVALIVPLFIGILIKKYKPEWASKMRKVTRPFVICFMVFVVVFGSLTNLYMFRMLTGPALIGGLALPWCGFMFGCFVALLTKRSPEDVTAIAVETGIQNTGIAILLLKASFLQPDADIGSLLPVIVAAFTPGPLLLGAAVHLTFKAMRRRREAKTDIEAVEKAAIELVDSTTSFGADKKLQLIDESLLPNNVQQNLLEKAAV